MTQKNREPLVAIVIVNWNRPLDTIECLESLGAISYENYLRIVVDNGSEDGSPEQIHTAVPAAEILVNPTNLGFATGVNVGITRALELDAQYVLLLNNDTVVDPGFLESLVSVCEEDPQVGIVGPSVYYYGTDRLFSSGGWSRRFRPLAIRQVHPPGPAGAMPAPNQEVEYIWGQAMLIRREVFEKVGLFDPAFFMYYEDCDFCRRAQRSGFRILYVPQSRIWHKVALSTAGSGGQRWQYKLSTMLYFHRKYARWGIVQAILQTAWTILGTGMREVKRGNLAWVAYPLSMLQGRTLSPREDS